MLNYVKNFIDSLQLSEECEGLAKVLFSNEEQCKSFYLGFLGRNRYIIDDLLDYREKRLAISDMTLDKFLNLCNSVASKDIFEAVFLQHFTKSDIGVINNALINNSITLSFLYNRFQENVNENIMKNVL